MQLTLSITPSSHFWSAAPTSLIETFIMVDIEMRQQRAESQLRFKPNEKCLHELRVLGLEVFFA
jgi:hypothetical protein